MLRVTEAEYLGGYQIRVAFSDGLKGCVDLAGKLKGPIFQPLQDARAFRRFQLTDHTIVWPHGADLAPEYLHELALQSTTKNAMR